MMHWTVNYIGLPYRLGGRTREGLDCWGLLRLVYKETKGIELPVLPGVAGESLLAISREIADQSKGRRWVQLQTAEEGCAVAMGLRDTLHHVGIWTVADGGKVIHCWDGQPVVADNLRNLRFKGIRTIKFFAYGFHH